MRNNLLSIIILIFSISLYGQGKEYHISITGNNTNDGSFNNPFKTIANAAKLAQPGDTITVHGGIYRERVNPLYGGLSDLERITYRAAENEIAIIKGSEVIKNWKKVKKGIWKITISNTFFGTYNPYSDIVGGDWYTTKTKLHTGEVYLNDKSFYEVDSLEKLDMDGLINKKDKFSAHKWFSQVDKENTTIWANFQSYNPNKELVEINVRPTCFYPVNTGVNYITVKGFSMSQAATQWAPPTAEQTGLIGPHWSKGWVIENNTISNSKCTGISLGKERSTGQNEWTRLKRKHGTQRERETIFKAIQIGWSKENIGSHVVRNNIIFDCEQAGICGHLGAIFSEIRNNHIYNINKKNQLTGAEIAGIKIHAGIDVLIKNNLIHDCPRGIWMDWQAQGARITGNVLFDNIGDDFFIEVCHGPHIVDNNIFLSKVSLYDASQGGAYIHNLFYGQVKLRRIVNRYTPYHFPHSTAVAGLMTTQTGDNRFYNNIFIKPESHKKDSILDKGIYGLTLFDDYPIPTDEWITGHNVSAYDEHRFPVSIDNNLYLNGAVPFKREESAVCDSIEKAEISIEEHAGAYYLNAKLATTFQRVSSQIITSKHLGITQQTESMFTDFDNSELRFDKDIFEKKRNTQPKVGPVELLENEFKIRVWPLTME